MLPRAPGRGSVLAGLVLCLALVAGCAGQAATPAVENVPEGDASPTSGEVEEATPPSYTKYVALGDSYTSAPWQADNDRPIGCMRSQRNYPRVIAEEIGAELVDVSCGGASTHTIFNPQLTARNAHPPQIRAVTSDTDLVTVSIGANNNRFFSEMMESCLELADLNALGSPCRDEHLTGRGADRLTSLLEPAGPRVSKVIDAIEKRAPGARIMVVGYPQVVPTDAECWDRFPIARGDYAYVAGLIEALSDTVEQAALSSGAEFIDLLEASRDHHICADLPWIAGVNGAGKRATGLHPFPSEQRAVADLLIESL